MLNHLPTNWQIKTLGEVCEILDNMRKPINSTEREQRLKNSTTKYAYYGATGQVGYIDDFLCDFESILLGEDGAPFLEPFKDKAYIVSGKYWVNNHAHILKAKENFAINKFVCYFLNIVDYMPYVSGTTRLKLNQSAMKQIKIPLPSLEIQKRIVARLERAFEKIEKGSAHLQDAKTKLAKYKQSLLKSAFDGTLTAAASLQGVEKAETIHKVDCHDLTSSKLAMTDKENPKLPQGWAIKTLGEVFKVVGGGTPSTAKTEFWNGNIAWITSADIDLQSFIITPKRFITNEAIQSSTTNCVEKDIIIVVTRVGLGKVGITDRQTCFSQDSQALIPLENVNVKFMAFQIKNQAKNFISVSRGTTINGITKNTLKELKLVVPPLEIQKQIVKLLEKHLQHADKTGEFIESALNKAKQLKQSLLKSAFLGKLT